MRARLILLPLCYLALASCQGDADAEEHGHASGEVQPGLGPRAPAPQPVKTEEPGPAPEVEAPAPPVAVTDPDPVIAERKQALADVGRAAFDALAAGRFDDLLALTPLVDPHLGAVCPGLPISPRDELEARFTRCYQSIDWKAVEEGQVFAGKPTGAPALGCDATIEDYGRLQLFLHMKDKTIWKVEFYGAVGEGGNAIGLNGEVSCSETDDAPALQ